MTNKLNQTQRYRYSHKRQIDDMFIPLILLSLAVLKNAAESRNKKVVRNWIDNSLIAPLPFELAWHWFDYGLKNTSIRLSQERLEHILTKVESKTAQAIVKWFEKEIRKAGRF